MYALAAAESTWKLFGLVAPLDMAVLVLLLAAMAIGFWTGLVWQLICVISVVVSFCVSYLYHPIVAEYLGSQLSEPVRRIVSALGVFILALLVCYLITFLFRQFINAIKPETPDRILGAVFGLFTGVLLIGVFAFAVLQYAGQDSSVRAHVQASKGATAMASVVRTFVYLLPDSVRESVDQGSKLSRLDQEPVSEPSSGAGTS